MRGRAVQRYVVVFKLSRVVIGVPSLVDRAGDLNLRILICGGCKGVLLVCTVFEVVVVVVRLTGKMRAGSVQDVC